MEHYRVDIGTLRQEQAITGGAVSRLICDKPARDRRDEVVADHARISDKGKTRYDWRHYLPLVQRKPGALRKALQLIRHA